MLVFVKFRYSSLLPLVVMILLVGCSDPLNYEVAKLTDEQRLTVRQILTADQLRMLDDWKNRITAGGNVIPPGVTVRNALNYQADWQAKRKISKEKATRLIKQAQEEHAEKQEEFAKRLAVTLLSKKNWVDEDERQFVALEISYLNKTEKDIREVKGVLILTNVYGNAIIDIRRSYDHIIVARGTAVDHDAEIPINKLIAPQLELWNTDFDKLKYTFEVQTINFEDGTSMKAPE